MIKATFEALRTIEGPRAVAARRGKRVADIIGSPAGKREGGVEVVEAANG
jgi:small subunit ribosomal protein S5